MTDDSSRKLSAAGSSSPAASSAASGAARAGATVERRPRAKAAGKGAGKGGSDYNAESIQILEGLEAVRKRPGMYIGSTDARGLHHLVWEVVDNSIDEAMAGYATRITVQIAADGMVTVEDDGRGVPVGRHKSGIDALEVVHTILHAGAKFEQGGYKVSGGLHGVGVSVVNALSEWMRVESSRDGFVGPREYARGKPTTKVVKVGAAGGRKGTKTSFRADPEMFEETDYSFETISQRLRESAYLNKRVWITFIDDRNDRERSFYFEGGLMSFVRHMNRNKEVLTQRPIYVERKEGNTVVEVALQYNDTYTENVLAFANNINTVDGGTHVTGFRAALTSSLNDWARKAGILKDSDSNLSGDDAREGLTAVISVKLPEPAIRGPDQGQAGERRGEGPGPGRAGRRPDPVSRGESGRRPADHREVPDRVPCPRGGPQGPRPRPAQGCPRRACPCPASSPTARSGPGAKRDLHRRGRLGRRLGQAGPRSPVPGDPALARQGPQRREGPPDRIVASENVRPLIIALGCRDRRDRRQLRPEPSCATTG